MHAQLNKQVAEQNQRIKKGVLSVIDVVIALGQRGIAFRGNWDKDKKTEDGNFNFFVEWKAKYDSDLRDHLNNAPRNAKYTSPVIQNKIISLCEKSIRNPIITDIPKFWSVMADETQDCSSTEQVSLCIRFIDKEYDVREEFLGFVAVKEMDAATIAEAILGSLCEWALDLVCCVGQDYDGASVMSSSKNGVQAKVLAECPDAIADHMF